MKHNIARNSEVPDLIRGILSKRNISDKESLERFLHPKLDSLPQPSLMKGLTSAASAICKAIDDNVEIIIWGDYDVDGTTGTALLINFFRELGIEIQYYIPSRLNEGYGLNSSKFLATFKDAIDHGALLVTVDCGISDSEAVREIKKSRLRGDNNRSPPDAHGGLAGMYCSESQSAWLRI